MGAKSGEVATVRVPGVTVFTLAAESDLAPQPAIREASIRAARSKLTNFFIFIFSFAVGLIDERIIL